MLAVPGMGKWNRDGRRCGMGEGGLKALENGSRRWGLGRAEVWGGGLSNERNVVRPKPGAGVRMGVWGLRN